MRLWRNQPANVNGLIPSLCANARCVIPLAAYPAISASLFLRVRDPPPPLVVLGDLQRLDDGGGFHPPRLSGFSVAD
jgi:hypothetical protein